LSSPQKVLETVLVSNNCEGIGFLNEKSTSELARTGSSPEQIDKDWLVEEQKCFETSLDFEAVASESWCTCACADV
jgi:hypothetical protein